ncbi:hypothetical protein LPJ53_000718 [Coemansia erecta]|uniref:Cyclin-like domain-containing protein n=1 Tax=Coemansia erecta TaxID=147472 RepID=A0A9W8CVN4_9FUNG|nr:hypothetical protein LPJ53_000718 [Coemansia erecta]
MAAHFGFGAYPAVYSPTMDDTSDQWMFRKEDLLAIPSNTSSTYSSPGSKHGSPDTQNWRTRGCLFIYNVVKNLNLRQAVASTACVYFHRFYMRQSVTRYHQYEIAGACVMIASKVEEHRRSLKEISKACAMVAMKGNPQSEPGVVEKWQRLLRNREVVVLENCCFDLDITHPYVFIDTLAMEYGIPVFIANSATAYVNDTMRSPICLLYKPEVVAVAALYFAMSAHKWSFNECIFDSRLVKLPANARREAEACIMDILDFYSSEAKAEKVAFKQQQQQQPQQQQQQSRKA